MPLALLISLLQLCAIRLAKVLKHDSVKKNIFFIKFSFSFFIFAFVPQILRGLVKENLETAISAFEV